MSLTQQDPYRGHHHVDVDQQVFAQVVVVSITLLDVLHDGRAHTETFPAQPNTNAPEHTGQEYVLELSPLAAYHFT